MTDLLLEDQGLCTFLQLKTAMTKKILVGDMCVPMGVAGESYTMIISKFKVTAFENYAAMYQVSYLCNILRKSSSGDGILDDQSCGILSCLHVS